MIMLVVRGRRENVAALSLKRSREEEIIIILLACDVPQHLFTLLFLIIICLALTLFTFFLLDVFPVSEWVITSASKTITTTPEDGDRVRCVWHNL